MASNSKKTHAKNLENLHTANTNAASIGAVFNSNNPLIKLSALTDFEEIFGTRMQDVNAAIPVEQTAVGEQITAFKLVSNRVSKTMKAAKGLGLTPEFLANLQSTSYRLSDVRVNNLCPPKHSHPPPELRQVIRFRAEFTQASRKVSICLMSN